MTEEVLSRKWLEVISKRNKLLSLSDWTQLPDCNIPPNIQRLWTKWREKIRNIKKTTVTEPDKAVSLLKTLEKQMPEKIAEDSISIVNVDTDTVVEPSVNNNLKIMIDNTIKETVLPKIISLDEITNIINQKSDNNLNIALKILQPDIVLSQDLPEAQTQLIKILNDKINKDYPKFIEELFTESVDYLSGSYTGDLPLLQLYATHYNKSLKDMSEDMLQSKRKWIKDISEIEKYRLEYLNKIIKSATIVELEELLKQIKDGHRY